VTTVADDEVVLFHVEEQRFHTERGLRPDTTVKIDGVQAHTLPRPPGARLATIATANDVHFGETLCGHIEALEDLGPPIPQPPGEPPYPETMNNAVVVAIEGLLEHADRVVVKGDLTTHGTTDEYAAFLACYEKAFGSRLVHVRGNHDAAAGEDFASWPTQEVALPGVTLAVIDTTIPGQENGQVTTEQLEWLDELGSRADRPVLVFGHHHVWSPESNQRPERYFGIGPAHSEALVEVFTRRRHLVGYFAGHTHRNRVRRFPATGDVPWVEVACTKDFPGAYAEYRIYEGGILQVFRRVQEPDAVDWAERTRALFGGLYPGYAFGQMADRCFRVC
jgi:3',5'-cyclic AMP phosphodiesterase CpdA